MTEYLAFEDLLSLSADLDVGPVHDYGLLESASYRPQITIWGREVYPSLDEKAAALLQSIVQNHALAGGNKRLGFVSLLVFYELNNVLLDASDDDFYNLVVAVAEGSMDLPDIAHQLQTWRHHSEG